MLRRNVLIFQSGALGDFVLTFPLAVAVARVFPQSRIFYVTSADRGALVDGLLRLEWADGEDGWHRLYSPGAELPPRALSLLGGATAVFALHAPPAVWLQNVHRINPEARVVTIDPRVPPEFTGHATRWAIDQLIGHPVEHTATAQIIRSLESRGLVGTLPGGGGVWVHPGAGSRDKCWPLKSFIELGRRLLEEGRSVRFVLGEVERDRWPAAERAMLAESFQTLSPATLIELHRLQITADVFIGNDSGPAHLAAVAGVPTIALFGPTSPEVWRPLGPAVVVLRGQPIEALALEDVLQSVNRLRPTTE